MTQDEIAARRLSAQQLAMPGYKAPVDLVAAMGAMQAQDYYGMQWALGVRLPTTTESKVHAAISSGELIRIHAFRGTWQLIAPNDVRWILELIGKHELHSAARRYRQLGMTPAIIRKSEAVFLKALEKGTNKTRAELSTELERAGIKTGARLSHLLHHAELSGLLCAGSRAGKQSTHALLDSRVPKDKRTRTRDELLTELATRYFRTRGPATAADFTWWSGLSAGEARRALEEAKPGLRRLDVDGIPYWAGESAAAKPKHRVHLLPIFDEYLVAYRDRSAVLDPTHAKRVNAGGGLLDPTVVEDGRIIGTWKRDLAPDEITVRVRLFEKATAKQRAEIEAAAKRLAAFVERKLALEWKR